MSTFIVSTSDIYRHLTLLPTFATVLSFVLSLEKKKLKYMYRYTYTYIA